jgi:hypothetical protein
LTVDFNKILVESGMLKISERAGPHQESFQKLMSLPSPNNQIELSWMTGYSSLMPLHKEEEI